MADIFLQETQVTPDSERTASEDIHEGDVVVRESGGGLHRVDPADDSRIDAIVFHTDYGAHIADHDEDFGTVAELGTYESGNSPFDPPIPVQPLVPGDVIKVPTPHDETVTEPSFSKNDVVGIISGPNSRPVLVEEGYTDDFSGASTTYNETNGNFIALGRVNQDVSEPQMGEDLLAERVEVRLDADVFAN